MKRLLTLSLAMITALGIAASAWSQAGGGAGGSGGAGGAGASGTPAAGAGAAGTGGTAGVGTNPGSAGTAGAAGQAGTAGVGTNAGTAGAAGQAGAAGTAGAAGQAGAVGTPGASGRTNGVSGAAGTRANLRSNNTPGAATRANLGQAPQTANENAAFNRIGQRPFFMDPGVRQQLNLNDNQFNTLNRAHQNAFNRFNQSISGLNNSLTEQQRQAQLQQFATQFDNDFNRTLDSVFTDPSQRSRFTQLRLQSMGFNAFNDAAIQRQLNLTQQQQQQLRQLAAQWRTQMTQFGDGTNIDQNQWSQLSAQFWDQLNSVLTPQQQQTWTQLIGQRHNFSPSAFFGPGNLQGSPTIGTLPNRQNLNHGGSGRGTIGTSPGPGTPPNAPRPDSGRTGSGSPSGTRSGGSTR